MISYVFQQKNGCCSLKNCYRIIKRDVEVEEQVFMWKKLWYSPLHEIIKLFMWKVLSNALPTRMILQSKLRKGDSSCVFCKNI